MKNWLKTSELWMGLAGLVVHFVPVIPTELKSVEGGIWTYVAGRITSKLVKANIK